MKTKHRDHALDSGVPPPACQKAAAAMDSMLEDSLPVFVSKCKAPEYQAMYPVTHQMLGHCRRRGIVPHRCVRHLALIELNDKLYHQSPLKHNELLERIATARVNETHTHTLVKFRASCRKPRCNDSENMCDATTRPTQTLTS